MGVTQYTFSAEQQEKIMSINSAVATRTMNGADLAIDQML